MLESQGRLHVRTFTAGGALPVENATVRIMGADENNSDVSYSLLTDRDGMTKTVSLPTPAVKYSLTPNPSEASYSTYDIEVNANGYFSKIIQGVSVFSGIETALLVNMIPTSELNPDTIPRGNNTTVIPQNQNLN